MMRPEIGSEFSKALAEARRAEAARDGGIRGRRASRRGTSGGLRVALGFRLVAAGHRLIGDAVEVG